MSSAIRATGLEQIERVCLLKLESQMVRQQGYISRSAFTGDMDQVFIQWESQGHIQLDEKELTHLNEEYVKERALTHSCHMSEELWIAVSCLRRMYACDL